MTLNEFVEHCEKTGIHQVGYNARGFTEPQNGRMVARVIVTLDAADGTTWSGDDDRTRDRLLLAGIVPGRL